MRVPKQLFVKGKRWTTRRVKDLTTDDGSPCSGLTDPNAKVINLDKALEGDDLAWVFWHEYGHALLWEAGVSKNAGGLGELAEEIICDALADLMTAKKSERFKLEAK